MSLITSHIGHGGAQRDIPQSTASPVLELCPVIFRIRHFGDELRHHLAVAAEAVAGKDQCAASDCLNFAIGTAEADPGDLAAFIGIDVFDRSPRDDIDARAFGGGERSDCSSSAPVWFFGPCMRRRECPG